MRAAYIAFTVTVVAFGLLLAACFSKSSSRGGGYDAAALPDVLLPGVNLPDAGTKRYSVGGVVDGLKGTGLVLEATGSDFGASAAEDVSVAPSGGSMVTPVPFTFPTLVPSGVRYSVVVKTQPSNPVQKCTVSSTGVGIVGRASVANIIVNCSTTSFIVGGTVTGVQGSGLVLTDNGGDVITVNTDGPFVFPTPVASGAKYAVAIAGSPTFPAETCSVTHATGVVGNANVTTVAISCVPETFNVGGKVVGLAGVGLVLTDNATDNLTVTANGAFTFAQPVTSGSQYTVTITSMPTNPSQVCTVAGPTGVVGDGDITSVVVNCQPNTFTVSGNVNNLAGSGLVLNTSAGSININSNGGFALPEAFPNGSSFNISVATQPTGPTQTCTVSPQTGVIAGANVTDVLVQCSTSVFTVGGQVSGLSAGSTLVLTNEGGDSLSVSGSGPFTFATPVASGSPYSVAIQTPASAQSCAVTQDASGVVAGMNVTMVLVACGVADGGSPVGDYCTNFQTDPNNCGYCGRICTGAQACVGGSCVCPDSADSVCNGACTNYQTDPNNCGYCGRICATGLVCQAGNCQCSSGTSCNGVCADLQTDAANCGSCGNSCPRGAVCQTITTTDGTFTGCRCRNGDTECRVVGDFTGPSPVYCANTQTDPNNCGSCGSVCPNGLTCRSGSCCAAGQSLCNGACVDYRTDINNCGSCGNQCDVDGGPSLTCQNGSCCPAGQSYCNGTCVDETSDPNNCNGCGNVCPNGSCTNSSCCPLPNNILCGVTGPPTCVDESVDPNCGGCGVNCSQYALTCALNASNQYSCCPGTQTFCSGACSDTTSDVYNCGSCGNDCTTYGFGAPACCNSACVDTSADPNNCQGCNLACASDPEGWGSAVCGANGCTLNCYGETDCAGACAGQDCCINTTSDPNNCNGCGTVCPAPTDPNAYASCSGSACGSTCYGGYSLCTDTGLCTPLSTDPNNCGTCDNVCPADTNGIGTPACAGGACTLNCGADTDCGGACVDTTTDTNNCDGCKNVCPGDPNNIGFAICTPSGCSLNCGGDGGPGTTTDCNGACVDTTSDPNNCNGCGNVCSNGMCNNSSCCPAGQALCGGACVNDQTDPNNCGPYCDTCPPGVACQAGVCACPISGDSYCAGTGCTDRSVDPNNCGRCGIVCPPGGSCVSGQCCSSGQALCGPFAGKLD